MTVAKQSKLPTVLPSTKGHKNSRVGAPRYLLCSLLGQGGMDTVWLAHDWTHKGKPQVAIKVFRGAAASERIAARFEREVAHHERITQAQREMGIKVVVPFLDQGIGCPDSELADINDRYMALEYVPGDSLRKILKDRDWQLQPGREVTELYTPWEFVRSVAQHVLMAIKLCHDLGIVHADVTPGNILLTRKRVDTPPMALLCDFGISFDVNAPASSVDTVTEPGMMRVTPFYITPEHVRGSGCPNQASDIFQFGMVLYEMATGRSFIPAAVINQETGQIRNYEACAKLLTSPLSIERYPSRLVTGMDPDFEQFILAALAPDPVDRPTAEEMQEKFRRLCELRDLTPEERAERANAISQRDMVRFSQVTIVEPVKQQPATDDELPDPELEQERMTLYGNAKKGKRWAIAISFAVVLGIGMVVSMLASSKDKTVVEYLRGTADSASASATTSGSGSTLASAPAPSVKASAAASSVLAPATPIPPTATASATAAPVAPTTSAEVPPEVSATYAEVMALPPGVPCPTDLMSQVRGLEKQHQTVPETFLAAAACYNRGGKYALAIQAMDKYSTLKKSGNK